MKPYTADDKPPAVPIAPPTQWRGLDEAAGSAEFEATVHNEFPEGASEAAEELGGDEVSRRRFMTLLGASAALATGAGCYLRPAPQRKIVPYTTQPDEIQPGIPLFYASAAPIGGYGAGVLVRSHEGRPIKIEGNSDHPSSHGGASIFALASVLDMYDPDRSRGVTHRGLPSSYENAILAVRKQLFDGTGAAKKAVRLRVLTETVTSPTLAAQINKLIGEFTDAKWVQHDPITGNNAAGTVKAFGKPLNVTYDFRKADVVVSLDADFLGSGPGATRYSRDFADRRMIRAEGKTAKEISESSKKQGVKPDAMNRLYAVECMPTSTGSVAEHRLAIPAGQVEAVALALAKEITGGPGTTSDKFNDWIKPLAADLKARGGNSIVVAGEHQPAIVHAAAHAINVALGSIGKTVFLSLPIEARPADDKRFGDLKSLTAEMGASGVDVLLILGGANPAYTASVDVPFVEAMKKVGFALHTGTHVDETGARCEWHLPETHYLEAWGDIRGHDGTATIQQPLIAPLYHGKSAIEFIADVLAVVPQDGKATPPREGLEIVQAYWNSDEAKKTFPDYKKPEKNFEPFWKESVRAGVVRGTAAPHITEGVKDWASGATTPTVPKEGEYEINFRADPSLLDGRYANNGWLQELPKPVTKITWDNAAFVSEDTAKKIGVKTVFRWTAGEHGRSEVSIIELKYGERTIKAPVWILPGHPDGAVTIHLGYGRDRAGKVATTPDEPNADGLSIRGFNAYALRTSASPWIAAGLTLTKTKKTYYLACTQAHWSMAEKDPISGNDLDRKPVRHGNLADYKAEPAFAKVPPMAAGETHEINENVPAPKHDDHSHGAGEGEKHGNSHALTMYYDDEKFERFTPGLAKEQQRRWAMAIDLSSCNGCSACVIACQSENNIPVVGKNQVTKGREMHWIRIDRYYEGKPGDANLKTLFQPVACVQCENAPCEIVCPVGATVHSADGLNDMVYNRCVGTRYCSNNCPYKVRRFNFLSFNDWDNVVRKLGRNPDVTVRSRGVMEKCTFCVQRIRGAEIVAEREVADGTRKPNFAKGERIIQDGEILTACQSACPSGAIVFGDLNDSHSAVAKWKNEPTNYGLLAELNTRPRLTHLAVVRNPNPAMPKGA